MSPPRLLGSAPPENSAFASRLPSRSVNWPDGSSAAARSPFPAARCSSRERVRRGDSLPAGGRFARALASRFGLQESARSRRCRCVAISYSPKTPPHSPEIDNAPLEAAGQRRFRDRCSINRGVRESSSARELASRNSRALDHSRRSLLNCTDREDAAVREEQRTACGVQSAPRFCRRRALLPASARTVAAGRIRGECGGVLGEYGSRSQTCRLVLGAWARRITAAR